MYKKIFISVFKLFAILVILLVIILLSVLYININIYLNELRHLDISKIYVKDSTKIYDNNNLLITELGTEKRDVISYDEISENMINAIVAIEDAKFFKHQGIDYYRIIGALIENLKTKSYKEGASTLTQQLVKLSFLSNEKSLERKLKEIFISIELENQLSKKDIIETYLNRVLFGGRIYGVEKASKYYFDKPAKELNYEEAAMLAGMVQSPNRFNPHINPELTKLRQIMVLQAMYDNNYITQKEFMIGKNRPITELVVKPKEYKDFNKYNEYIDYVIHELIHKYKLDPFNDSLHVITNLNLDIQDIIYEIENDKKLHPNDKTQTGIVVLETNTGKIIGIGGGRNYKGSLSFNYATDAKLQPGSTIKPILDYGPAIEYLKYSPAQPFFDEKIYFNTEGSRYFPVYNYDNKYKGFLSMREAIIDSRNVTAVKAFREVGYHKAYEFAEKLGLSISEPITEAHAIGGYRYGYSVLEMAGAYAAFGNQGIYNEPTTIDYILYNNEKLTTIQKRHQAMREDTAYLMSHILHDNMIYGTARTANVNDLYIAGKTGQTNYDEETRIKYDFPSNSVRDSWFIGYTTKYTTSVWLGYDRIDKNAYLTPNEAKSSLKIFREIMDKIHFDRQESKTFSKPDNIIEVEVETNTYPLSLPSEYTPSKYRKKELFIKGTEPKVQSNFFQPLKRPKNFIVYYDGLDETINFKWDKYEDDYSDEDFKLMEEIHEIENFYDYYKNKTQQEFYQGENLSFLENARIKNILNDYCINNVDKYCSQTNRKLLNSYISLLENLKQFEINRKTENKKVKILSEGELSLIRGYKTWNGYQNGIYSNLGKIEYRIYGHKGLNKILLYQGPYVNNIKLKMELENLIEYDMFSIVADYSKYRYHLRSKENISLNPFYSIGSLNYAVTNKNQGED